MTEILTEVKHELQQEKLHLAVIKYYKGAIALVACVIILTGIYVYKRESNISEQEGFSKEYYKLFMSGSGLSKIKETDFGKLTNLNHSAYSKLAKFRYVDFLVAGKEYGKAVELLFDITKGSKDNLEIANFAKIRGAELITKHRLVAYNDTILDILRKATRDDKVPYFYVMKLLLGRVLIESGKQDDALVVLKALSNDQKTPNNIKFFANTTLENYLN